MQRPLQPSPQQHAATRSQRHTVKAPQPAPAPHKQQQPVVCQAVSAQQRAAAAAAVAAVSLLCSSSVAQAAPVETNWATKCAGCHVAGGNIIQAGATLFQEDLVRNGYADSDSLYKLLYSGKGRMPGFGTECAPKLQCTFGPRLSDEELEALVQYVQDQAAAGWKAQPK